MLIILIVFLNSFYFVQVKAKKVTRFITALILLSGCQQTTNQLSDITRYVEEKIAEGKGTEVKSKEQETDTEQAAVCGETCLLYTSIIASTI